MSKPLEDPLTIHINISIAPSTLKTIVNNAKAVFGKDPNGRYTIDTADLTSELISRFLVEKDFESYVKDTANYVPE